MKSDIEIAQSTELKNICDVAKSCGIDEKYLSCYGRYKAKVCRHRQEMERFKAIFPWIYSRS